MPAEHPEIPILTRDEAQRIRACRVVHSWISAEAFAALEFCAGCRGEHVDRLVSTLIERVALCPGAINAILPEGVVRTDHSRKLDQAAVDSLTDGRKPL